VVNGSTAGTIDEYIDGFPHETQKVLREVRTLIRETAPEATETIRYGMPTFDLRGKYLVYFAGYKKHVGLYPVTAGVVAAFREEVEPYWNGKGTLQFPLSRPMPTDLIRRIVELRVRENADEGPE